MRFVPSVRAMGHVVEHVVERGDTVVRIARRYGTFSSNVVTATGELPNPYRLKYGQTLYVRPIGNTKPTTHTFILGETVAKIAAQHEITSLELLAANPGLDFNSLIQGQTLRLPVDAGRLG